MSEVIFIPFKKELYDDLVRFSDGAIDPADIAVGQVENWIERGLGYGDYVEDWFAELFHERLYDFVEKYAPEWVDRLQDRERKDYEAYLARRLPLVWKEVTIPGGSEVRMLYQGEQHYASVKNGRIVDEDGEFSPSSWAAKITSTARNAWRDLWFKLPGSKDWVPAEMLRQRARRALQDVEESNDA
jgi:hypothetical protein